MDTDLTPKQIREAERRVQEESTFGCARCGRGFSTSDEFHDHRDRGECDPTE
jgi:hypothetical protein